MLDELHWRLLEISPGTISEKDLPWWASDAVLTRLLKEAVVLRPNPRHVLYNLAWRHWAGMRGGAFGGMHRGGGVIRL